VTQKLEGEGVSYRGRTGTIPLLAQKDKSPQVRAASACAHHGAQQHVGACTARVCPTEGGSDTQHYLAIAEDAGVAVEAPAHAVKTAAPGRARHVRTVAPGGA